MIVLNILLGLITLHLKFALMMKAGTQIHKVEEKSANINSYIEEHM